MKNQKRKWHHTIPRGDKKFKQLSMKNGMTGFLCTCNFREKECIKEAYKILEQYNNEFDFSVKNEEIEDAGEREVEEKNVQEDNEDISDALNKEISELNAQAKKPLTDKKFQYIETGVKNVIFIKSTIPDPLELTMKIVKDLEETKKQQSRYILRLIPIQIICETNLLSIKSEASAICEKYFAQEPKTFSIIVNRRYNNTVRRDLIIETLASVVSEKNPGNKVNLTNPDITVVVEIIKNFCLLSIAPQYFKYKKYNLLELCNVTSEQKSSEGIEVSKEVNEPTKESNIE